MASSEACDSKST